MSTPQTSPTLLAVDTSSALCSVALLQSGQIHELSLDVPRQHTTHLLPMVDELLAQHQLSLRQLDGLAFGSGPGSFTGLRIAAGVVQGLAFAADLPVLPVSTLAALAHQAYRQHGDVNAAYVAMLDARMSEVYWGAWQFDLQPVVAQTRLNVAVSAPQEVQLPTEDSVLSRWIGVGPGWHYSELGPVIAQLASEPAVATEPAAYDVVALAQSMFERGEGVEAEAAMPTYVRDQVSWKKRTRLRPQPV